MSHMRCDSTCSMQASNCSRRSTVTSSTSQWVSVCLPSPASFDDKFNDCNWREKWNHRSRVRDCHQRPTSPTGDGKDHSAASGVQTLVLWPPNPVIAIRTHRTPSGLVAIVPSWTLLPSDWYSPY